MNMDGFADLAAFGNTNLTVWSGNGGTNWTQIANFSTPTPGSYVDLTVADADHNGYPDIVIEALEGSGFNQYNKLRFFKETTPYSTLSITPLYPGGFERIKNNRVVFIDWISAAPLTPASKVKLEFSQTGNSGPWTVIADSLPNNGRHQWQAPAPVNSEQCFIRYTVYVPGQSVSSVTPNRFIIGNLIGISNKNTAPAEFKLYQNYPNPFNPATKIRFSLPLPSKGGVHTVSLSIFDVLGKEVRTLINGSLPAGEHEIGFDGTDLPSGVYFYRLNTGEFAETRKMILLK
jgi:hypothetical protein